LSDETLIWTMRGGWIVLACLMLFSRAVFQAAGDERMRAFLNEWQDGRVKRTWGAASLLFAALLAAGALTASGGLRTLDWILLGALLAVLVADGLVNILPTGFRTFKERLQTAWVAQHRGTGRENDRHLFGTVNALLAIGSLTTLAVVIGYRPVELWAVALAVAIAVMSFCVRRVSKLAAELGDRALDVAQLRRELDSCETELDAALGELASRDTAEGGTHE